MHNVIRPRALRPGRPGETHDERSTSAVRGVYGRGGTDDVNGEGAARGAVDDADGAVGLGAVSYGRSGRKTSRQRKVDVTSKEEEEAAEETGADVH